MKLTLAIAALLSVASADEAAKKAYEAADSAYGSYFKDAMDAAELADKYADMTQEEKDAWDKKWDDAKDKREEFYDELRKVVTDDWQNFGDAAKVVFMEELLDGLKTIDALCKDDAEAIVCTKGKDLLKKRWTAMAGKGDGEKSFFSEMTADERKKFATDFEETAKKNIGTMVKAWLEANKPAAGENGATCGEEGACPEGQCCGYSVPYEKPADGTIVFDSASDAADAAGALGGEEVSSQLGGISAGLSMLGGAADLIG